MKSSPEPEKQFELGASNIPVISTALAHYQARRYAEAQRVCQEVLARNTDDAEALEVLGLLAGQAGQLTTAEALIRRAISLRPDNARYHNDLGMLLSSLARPVEAVVAFETAIGLNPGYVEAHNNLGTVLRRLGKLDEAIAAYQTAVARMPNFAEAHYNLGNALKDRRMLDQAIVAYRKAIELRPDFAQAYSNLGVALKDTRQLDESIDSTRRALALKPNLVAASNLLCTLHYPNECDPDSLFQEHLSWSKAYCGVYAGSRFAHANDRTEDRRLRVGYVSPDFSSHPVGCCLLPVLRNHDHSQFEIICYSDVRKPDGVTAQLRSHADTWRETANTSDEQLANLIRKDQVDILIDLAVHTNENRLPVFARKPAPVQVTWLGWPGTTGLDAIDYRLSDPYLDPPERERWLYSEKTICLPHSFWCYDSLSDEPAVNDLPAQRNGFITFGCFNNFCKITDFTLALWAKVMSAAAGSRLLVMSPRGASRDRLTAFLGKHGISSDRVEFVDRQTHQEYLKLYNRIDVCLDTVPYAGHTTSMDSFWMGVPVVSLVGEIPVWRAGLSILSNLGMPELVAHSADQYVSIAADLTAHIGRLAGLRATLRERMESSPIMNGAQYARDLERVLRDIWRKWCMS